MTLIYYAQLFGLLQYCIDCDVIWAIDVVLTYADRLTEEHLPVVCYI